ncbi:MAG: universal stress protein, partial [Candidatus Thermoplasmatota archaeon]|nr:universal stress protein [Candidatus Thermoplasmatota archaeon]
MFKQILLPISSEFYRADVLERVAFLAQKFGSIVTLLYIIEEKTLQQADKRSDAFRTCYDRNTTKEGTIETYKRTADSIIFQEARRFFKKTNTPFEEKIAQGEFSTVINQEITSKPYDLLLMGFEKACVLNYRLMDELPVDIPLWAVSNVQGNDAILAVCSNLAPNQKVPEVSLALAKAFGWKLQLLYVVDTKDAVEVDT